MAGMDTYRVDCRGLIIGAQWDIMALNSPPLLIAVNLPLKILAAIASKCLIMVCKARVA